MKISRAVCLCSMLAASLMPITKAVAEQTYSGAVCLPRTFDADPFLHHETGNAADPIGIYNRSANPGLKRVYCPTPIDHNINNANWSIRVEDRTSAAGFQCQGFVLNSSGALIAATPSGTTTAAFVGATTLSVGAGTGGYSTEFIHYVACDIPHNVSGIVRITLN